MSTNMTKLHTELKDTLDRHLPRVSDTDKIPLVHNLCSIVLEYQIESSEETFRSIIAEIKKGQ